MTTLASAAPRFRSVLPGGSRDLVDRALEVCVLAGLILDDWQQDVLAAMLTTGDADRFLHFEVGVNVARQNGKGAILEARELAGLFVTEEELLIHTAHEFATSQEHFRRVEMLIDRTPELKAQVKLGRGGQVGKHSHGDESIELKDGKRILFKTRTKSGMRGFAGVDLLVLDEAMILPAAAHGASMPIVRASDSPHGPQMIYAGSAVDQLVHEHGLVWARVRERGVSGDDPSLAYFEWSADAEHPTEVSEAMAADVESWRQANPALGIRVSLEHMEREFRSMDPRTFAVELLGVGDWPATDGLGESLIDLDVWLELADTDAAFAADMPVCLAFDVSPDRRSSVAKIGVSDRGGLLAEVMESRPGTAWVPGVLSDLYRALEVEEVVCDGFGPSASIAKQADEAGITVRRLNAGELGQACGRLIDVVDQRDLSHRGQPGLEAAIRGATPRPLGDAWAWSRKNSSVDISPLVAVTIGVWSAVERDLMSTGIAIF